jgi:TIR domain
MSTIFISHSSEDNVVAAEMRDRLVAQEYHSVFLDFDPKDGIPAGRDWEKELYQKLVNLWWMC